MKKNLVAEVMGEHCIFGGLLATRGEVYEDLSRLRRPDGTAMDALWLDRLTWMCPAASADQAECLAALGMTLVAVRSTWFRGRETGRAHGGARSQPLRRPDRPGEDQAAAGEACLSQPYGKDGMPT